MIKESYTLLSRIPLLRDTGGAYFADQLWAQDLNMHLEYIADFRICCPVVVLHGGTAGFVRVNLVEAQIVPLLLDRGWLSVFANLIPNLFRVRSAIKGSAIVHSDGAGWAFPTSYYLLLGRRPRSFRWVMVIESTFWMSTGNGTRLRTRLAEPIHRYMLRRALREADARIFTQKWYRDVLLGAEERTLVSPAVWVRDTDIAETHPKVRRGPLRLIFPARLTEEKGVETVLGAIRAYKGSPMHLDIVGSGPLAGRVSDFAKVHGGRGPATVALISPVPYGEPFYSLLRSYDGVVIAALTEEQPRIAFDAFSQGVPCIASNTHGNRSVMDATRGFTFAPGNSAELSEILSKLATNKSVLKLMGPAALAYARLHGHRQMHDTREAFLRRVLNLS